MKIQFLSSYSIDSLIEDWYIDREDDWRPCVGESVYLSGLVYRMEHIIWTSSTHAICVVRNTHMKIVGV
jgi:hypothetical protein